MIGKLHSIETMGMVDGPGIRTVFFMQGCPLRCAYCHNPDSQSMFSNKEITPEEVLNKAKRYKGYYKRSGGGITFSGGEPLIQGKFILESLKLLKDNGFNTAIDTSGYGQEEYYREILKYTDIILLDVKSMDNNGYKELTGRSMNGFYKFISYLEDFKGKIWIRHVMVPGINDNKESVTEIFNKISHLSDKIEKIEVLPYHRMGVEKYESLGMEYTLRDVPEMDSQIAMNYQNLFMELLEEWKSSEKQKNITRQWISPCSAAGGANY